MITRLTKELQSFVNKNINTEQLNSSIKLSQYCQVDLQCSHKQTSLYHSTCFSFLIKQSISFKRLVKTENNLNVQIFQTRIYFHPSKNFYDHLFNLWDTYSATIYTILGSFAPSPTRKYILFLKLFSPSTTSMKLVGYSHLSRVVYTQNNLGRQSIDSVLIVKVRFSELGGSQRSRIYVRRWVEHNIYDHYGPNEC